MNSPVYSATAKQFGVCRHGKEQEEESRQEEGQIDSQ